VSRLRIGQPEFYPRQGQLSIFSPPPRPDWLYGPSSLLSKGHRGGGGCPGLKSPGCEADHSPTSSAEVKNERSYTFTPQYVFMAWFLFKHMDNFILGQNVDYVDANWT
jgi:hypothetical protein